MQKVDDLLEIRWHSRGGQGAKTAVLLLAQAVIREGRHAQGFPEYGPERMGAPMRGYNRIADRPIRRRGPIEEPGIVVVLDPSLLKEPSFLQGLQSGSLLLVNTARTAEQVAEELPELVEDLRVHVVDATEIARAETGSPIPNIVMLGALLRLTNAARPESVRETVAEKLKKKVGSKGSLLSGNLAALERAQKEVR